MKLQVPPRPVAPHPCEEFPDGAMRTFDLIAQGQQPPLHCPWIALLKRRNCIIEREDDPRVIGENPDGKKILGSTYRPLSMAMAQWQAHQRSLAERPGIGDTA